MSAEAAAPTPQSGVAASTPEGELVSPSSAANEETRLRQALLDLRCSEASEVCLIRCESATEQARLVESLMRRARQSGCVTATLSLRQHSLESLDEVVRRLVLELVPPTRSGASSKRGLLALLDAFARRHREESGPLFEERAARLRAAGDLTSLSHGYLVAHTQPSEELIAFNAWLSGTELSRRAGAPVTRAALSVRTARRALSELTRVIRALGFSGSVFCLTDGELLTRRTDRQRAKAYTVLRELIDNFDSGRGTLSTRLVLTGRRELFEGPRSLQSLTPLLSRLEVMSIAGPAPPHRSLVTLSGGGGDSGRRPVEPPDSRARELRALVRISQGLPPTEGITSLSVGHERIDSVIERLFEHARMAGSVFSVLTGDYGAGKTHLLMHLSERALERRHPVFRLDLERLDFDLGNPQRHLARLLEQSVLPLRRRPSAIDRAGAWTRSASKLQELLRALQTIAAEEGEAAAAAGRALRRARSAKDPGPPLEAFLTARGLASRPASPTYRQDAYERLLLWLELLRRLDGCEGPVVLIDEAENLYTGGAARSVRRTALRSLSFYCGGALPSACVLIAITPRVLKELRKDARELLSEVSEQRTVLPWEDAVMLSRRLSRLKPELVPELTPAHSRQLVERVVETHRSVRGAQRPLTPQEIRRLTRGATSPRVLLRCLVDELERRFWEGRAR